MEPQALLRKPYPSDVSDDEWAFVAPYLTLMPPAAPQRVHELREVFNALRWLVRAGAPWRYLPTNFPPWEAVSQQTRRWLAAGVFAAMAHDLRIVLRWAEGRADQPTAAIFDSATRQSTPESGPRAGDDGHKRRQGSQLHLAVDTLGHLLALHVTPTDGHERAQVGVLAAAVQAVTGEHVALAFVDQGYTGETPAATCWRMASSWRWSSCPRPSAASCSCPGAGWWSGRSPGSRASGAWPNITNGCRKRSKACISWPLPA